MAVKSAEQIAAGQMTLEELHEAWTQQYDAVVEQALLAYIKHAASFARRWGYNWDDAQDIAQDAFLIFWSRVRAKDYNKPQSKALTFFLGITFTKIRAKRNTAEGHSETSSDEETTQQWGDPDIDPEYAALLRIAVSDCLRNHTKKERDMIHLYCEGYKYVEIAQEMNIPFGRARRQVWIAVRAFRTCLESKGITPG